MTGTDWTVLQSKTAFLDITQFTALKCFLFNSLLKYRSAPNIFKGLQENHNVGQSEYMIINQKQ